MNQLLSAHIKAFDPKDVINCINNLCPEVSGLCYFENGELMSKDKNYSFYFDPMHRVIEVNKI